MIKFEHQHDIIYQVKCSAESSRRLIQRIKDHGGRDTKSSVLEHINENEHVEVIQKNFRVNGSYFDKNRLKTKIAEALLIKKEHLSLNVQDQSVELKLLN